MNNNQNSLNLDIGNEEMAISKIMEKEVFNELNDELKGKVIDIYKHYQKQKNESTIENKKYNVITRVTKQKLSKDNLIKLIARYGIQELQSENL